MTSALGTASGTVHIDYTSTGAAQVVQELGNLVDQMRSGQTTFNQTGQAFQSFGNIGGQVSGTLSGGVQDLIGVFGTLGRAGPSGLGAVSKAFGILQNSASQAMQGVKQAITAGGQGVAGAAGGVGNIAGAALGGAMKLAMGGTIAAITAAVAGIGIVLGAGLKRLVSLDEARFKLKALGYDGEQVKGIMDDVKEAVLGTAYSLDEAATAAGQALAAGVKPGEELTKYLKNVASVAAVSGREFGEVAHTMNQITAQGKLMGIQLRQLEMSGLAPVEMLSKQLGKSQTEIRDMVSKGQITAQIWQDTVTGQMGDAADIMGKSIMGSLRNLKAAVGRMGEGILAPLFTSDDEKKIAPIPGLINNVSKAIDEMGKKIGAWVAQNRDSIMQIFSVMKTFASFVIQIYGGYLKVVFTTLATIWKAAWEVGKQIFGQLAQIMQKWSGDGKKAMDSYKDGVNTVTETIKKWGPTIAQIMATMASITLQQISIILKGLSMFAEFLGHVGPVVLNFAEVTIKSFQAIAKGAGKLGGILEKVPDPLLRLSGKALKGVEKGWDAADQSLQGARKSLDAIHGAAPKMGEMSNDINQMSKSLREVNWEQVFAATSTKKLADATKRGGKDAADAAEAQMDLKKILEELKLSMDDLQKGITGSEQDYKKLLKTLQEKGAPPQLVNMVKDLRKEFKELDPTTKKVADNIKAMGEESITAAGKGQKLIEVLEALGVIETDVERVHTKYHETLEKSVEFTDDWVDSLFAVGPALIGVNGALDGQSKNAREAKKRITENVIAMSEWIAAGGDAEEAFAETEATIRSILGRIGITAEADIQRVLGKYMPERQTLEIATSVTDADETKAQIAAIFLQTEKAKREGKDKLDMKFKFEGDPEELRQAVEQYGIIWQDYNELSGIVKLEIPSTTELLNKRQEIEVGLRSKEPLVVKAEVAAPEIADYKAWYQGAAPLTAEQIRAQQEAAKGPEPPKPFIGPKPIERPAAKPAEKPSEVAESEKDAIKTFTEEVPNLFKPAVDKAQEQGKKFAEAFAAGILSGVSAVQQAAITVAANAAGALPSSPAKYGPLAGQGAPNVRGKKFTSAFASGIASNVAAVKSSAVSVAYGAAQPMHDRFTKMIEDIQELSGFARKAADFLKGAVDLGVQIGKLFTSFMPKQYQAVGKKMTAEQAARLQEQQRITGQPVAPIIGGVPGAKGKPPEVMVGAPGAGVSITANAGNVEVSTAGTTVPLVQNPDGTWTSPDPEWAKLIKRESAGRATVLQEIEDMNKGANKAQGLFQITPETWRGAGGERFAAVPNLATPQQQAAIAAEIFGQRGGQPWGSGAGQQFGRENEALLRAGLVSQQANTTALQSNVRATQANSGALKGASATYSKSYLEAAGLQPLYTPGEYAYGSGKMPPWVEDMAKQFGVQVGSSISASGATSTHGAGFGFDFSGTAQNMERLADYIQNNLAKDTLQLIYQSPAGKTYNVAGGEVLQGTTYYGAGTFGQHQDHVHWAAAVAPILANANANAMGMPDEMRNLGTAFAGTGARPGPIPAPGPRPGPIDDAIRSVVDLGSAAKDSTSSVKGLGNQSAGTARDLGQVQGAITGGPIQGAERYGLPIGAGGAGGYGVGGQQLFPQWVRDIETAFGIKASTYSGHQESAGFGFTERLNKGIDWVSDNVDNMQRFAEWLASRPEVAEQVIWQNPVTGQQIGVYGGKADVTKSIFAGDYAGHTDHVHTRQSFAILTDALGANTSAVRGQGQFPTGVGVTQLPQQDSNALQGINRSMLGLPDAIADRAANDPLLTEAIAVARSGQMVDASQAVPLLSHMDGLIAEGNSQQDPQTAYLSQIRDGIMTRAGVEEVAPGGGMLDQIGTIAGGVSTIINDFFDIFDTTLKAIAATKDIGDTLARGIANTEDIMKMIDGFQVFLELGAKIAQTVSDIAGFAADLVGSAESAAGMGGGAAAALQAVSAIAGIISGVINMINQGIELAQEAYRIGTKYMARMIQAWLGLPGANDVRYLLDTLTGQLQAYTTENPELKQTFNTLGRTLGFAYQERIGAQNQFNIYQGPGQDPRDTMSDAMFAVRSSGVGAFGYAGQ